MIRLPVKPVLVLGGLGIVINNYAFLHDLLWGKGAITMGLMSGLMAVVGAGVAGLSLVVLLALVESRLVVPRYFHAAKTLLRRQNALRKTVKEIRLHFSETLEQTERLSELLNAVEAELAVIQKQGAAMAPEDG